MLKTLIGSFGTDLEQILKKWKFKKISILNLEKKIQPFPKTLAVLKPAHMTFSSTQKVLFDFAWRWRKLKTFQFQGSLAALHTILSTL